MKASLPAKALSGWVRVSPQSTDFPPLFYISSFYRTVLAALLLGSHEDCSHYALSVDAMDSNRLGEALSPTAWATVVVLSVAALLAC